MNEKNYKTASRLSTQYLVYTLFLQRILAESKDPHITKLAGNALEAAKVCKENEPRALYLMYGEAAKKFLNGEDWEQVSRGHDYE